mmetsp:Transcript_66059/g.177654  ORF Transcript_66059/g.177654 Transcript_66059/m.177654 type:complete len:732 (-) Transcript_66059:61-2256(-)
MYYQQYPPRQATQSGYAASLVSGNAPLVQRHPAAVPQRSNVPSYTPVSGGGGSVMAHSASQSSMQGMPQPTAISSGGGLPMAVPSGGGIAQATAVPSGGGIPCSPQLQIRATMCSAVLPPAKEPVLVRAVATPLRTEEAPGWSVPCSRRLCSEGRETRFIGKARFLEKHLFASVEKAVDGLNRRLLVCPDDCCVVFCVAERSYYLLYRSGKREAAFAQLGLAVEAGGCASPRLAHERASSRGSTATAACGARVRQDSRSSAGGLVAGGPKVQDMQTAGVSGGASANTPAASPAPVSSGRNGRPPLRTAVTRTPSASGVQSYMPASHVFAVDGAGGAASPAYQRYASPAPAVQSFQPAPAWCGAARFSSGAATPTPPIPPPQMMAVPSGGQRLVSAPMPPTQQSPHGHALRVVHTGSAIAPPAEMQGQIQGRGFHVVAPQRLSTPRETLECGLSAPEKIIFEDLEFVESLGSGEFGQVFRGSYQGNEVAIKKMYWDDTMSELVMQDLSREIESFRHLRHKRLVRFIGACLELPHPCLVTEYCPGGSLHHLLHVRRLELPLLHALNMCLQIADGVMYLHSHTPTIVHRDLKSLNVVLDLSLNVKICDFGLTEPMERTHITKKNNGGSPRYMAPELFDNKSKITEKVDIWSMGCIFTEIFGGTLPYQGINTLADLTREMLVNRRMPAIPPHIPEPAQNVIRSCYNFDSRLRPTAKQVFEQLREAKRRLRAQGQI